MWKVRKIDIKNLQSVDHAEVNVNQGVATLVVGVNNTEQDQESNGAGKSVVLEALSLLLLAEPMRKLPVKKLIQRGASECNLEIQMYNTRTKEELSIKRAFFLKKASKVEIVLNGVEEQVATVDMGNERILSILGLSAKELRNYYLMTGARYSSFLLSGESVKKQLINTFADADIVDPVISSFDSKVKGVDVELAKLGARIEYIESELSRMEEAYLNEETHISAAKKAYDDGIKSIEDNIGEKKRLQGLKHIRLNESSLETRKLESSLKEATEELGVYEKQETEARQLINDQRDDYTRSQQVVSSMKSSIAHDNVLIQGSCECPKCLHMFAPTDSTKDLAALKLGMPLREEELRKGEEGLKAKVQSGKDAAACLSIVSKAVVSKRGEVSVIQQRLSGHKAQHSRLEAEDLTPIIATLQSQIDEIKNVGVVNPIDAMRLREGQLIKDLEKEREEVEALTAKKGEFQSLHHLSKRFKTFLINRTLSIIEFHANDFLNKSGSDLTLMIDGYALDSKGKLREKIDVKVARAGVVLGDYKEFSLGECGRLELACIYAFHTVTNNKCERGGLDMLFLDEILVNVDSLGLEGQLKSLSDVSKTSFIITHATMKRPYLYTLTATKTKGTTYVT